MDRQSVTRLAVGAALALLLFAASIAAFPRDAPVAALIAGALVLASLAARAARLHLLAREANAATGAGATAAIAAGWAALDAAFFRGLGAAVGTVLFARRGAGLSRAAAATLAILALDAIALALGALVVTLALYDGAWPDIARRSTVPLLVVAIALAFAALAAASRAGRALDARLPVAWREADATPARVVAAAARIARRAGVARLAALTVLALACDVAVIAVVARSFGVALADGAISGLFAATTSRSLGFPPGFDVLHSQLALAAVRLGADWTAAFAAGAVVIDAVRWATWAAGAAAVAAWALPSRRAARAPRASWTLADARLARDEPARLALALGVAVWVRALQWRDALPFARRDVRQHHEYVTRVLEGDLLPLAPDFFMAYHPPLWYWIAAAGHGLVGPAAYWILNGLAALALVGVVHVILARLDVPPRPRLVATLGVAVVPALVGASLNATNDVLVALLAALTVLLALPLLEGRSVSASRGLALGGAAGLALLAKANALVPLAAFALVALVARRGRLGRGGWLAAGVALALAGPWYARNALVFGTPFVTNQQWFGGETTSLPPSFFLPRADVLLREGESNDFLGLLVQSLAWPHDSPFTVPSAALAAVGLPLAIRTAFLLAGAAALALALVGALVALARGAATSRALALAALAMLAVQVAYVLSVPKNSAVSAAYLLPGLAAFAYVCALGGTALRRGRERPVGGEGAGTSPSAEPASGAPAAGEATVGPSARFPRI